MSDLNSNFNVKVVILQTQQTNSLALNVSHLFSYIENLEHKITFETEIIPVQGQFMDAAEFNAVKDSIPSVLGNYVIYILDTSISSSSPQNIYELIKQAIILNEYDSTSTWDLTYLCKWMDNCSIHQTVINNVSTTNAKIVRTFSANGFQAVIFSPVGLQKLSNILNLIPIYNKPIGLTITDQVNIRAWRAYAIIPNLITFDPALSKPNSYDYVKLSECRDPLPLQAPTKDSNMSFFWFIMVAVIVVTIIYILIKIAPHLDGSASISHGIEVK